MRRNALSWGVAACIVGLGFGTACGGDGQPCTPGAQVACQCPDGSSGIQVCLGSGDAYGSCTCDDPSAGGAGGQGEGGSIDTTGQPPTPPEGASPGDSSAPRAFAATSFFLGTTTFEGQSSDTAWTEFGWDIDHADTGTDFSGHCMPVLDANPDLVFPDGPGGVDNAFGKVLAPLFFSQDSLLDMSAATGLRTIVLDLPTLGTAADYQPLSGTLIEGLSESNNQWLVAPESLMNGKPLGSFPDGYLVDNTWVSRRIDTTLVLLLRFGGETLRIQVHKPLVTAELEAGHDQVLRGTISGILKTDEFATAMREFLGRSDPSFCEGAAIEGIITQISMASDTMSDGTQNPDMECDGISFGMGFRAEATQLGGDGAAIVLQPACQ